MAEFIYRSTVYGPQVFRVPDGGGILSLNGKKLNVYGGYLIEIAPKLALRADATSLEFAARAWWRKRNAHLDALGHKANGVRP